MPGAEVRLTMVGGADGQKRAIRTILPPIKEISTPRLTALEHSVLVYELSFGAEIRLTIADGETSSVRMSNGDHFKLKSAFEGTFRCWKELLVRTYMHQLFRRIYGRVERLAGVVVTEDGRHQIPT